MIGRRVVSNPCYAKVIYHLSPQYSLQESLDAQTTLGTATVENKYNRIKNKLFKRISMKTFFGTRDGDSCGCLLWPNGIFVVLPAQLLLIAATVLSGMAVFDCQYVDADIGNLTTIPDDLVGLRDGTAMERRGFGFYVHENGNDECRWDYWRKNNDNVTEEYIDNYIDTYDDFMGKEWRAGRVIGMIALIAGFLLTLYALTFGCIAHIKPLRYSGGACAVSLITITQLIPLFVLNSDFCSGRDCKLGRSGIYGIIAGGVFLVSGSLFYLMKDYPGLAEDGEEDVMYEEEPGGQGKDELTHQDDDGHVSDDENKRGKVMTVGGNDDGRPSDEENRQT